MATFGGIFNITMYLGTSYLFCEHFISFATVLDKITMDRRAVTSAYDTDMCEKLPPSALKKNVCVFVSSIESPAHVYVQLPFGSRTIEELNADVDSDPSGMPK